MEVVVVVVEGGEELQAKCGHQAIIDHADLKREHLLQQVHGPVQDLALPQRRKIASHLAVAIASLLAAALPPEKRLGLVVGALAKEEAILQVLVIQEARV